MNFIDILAAYWNSPHLHANFLIMMGLVGALALGLLIGYERSYHGRAAGMRTYGLVCMASAAIVLVSGYPELWYGLELPPANFRPDPTRSIQGIVTGIGFLCAGVIMHEGFNISGLTTAASIWTACAVGILVGVGFYLSALTMALVAVMCMTLISKLEAKLPARPATAVKLRFKTGYLPDVELIRTALENCGFKLAKGSIAISHHSGQSEWSFVAVTSNHLQSATILHLSDGLLGLHGVEDFQLTHARN